MRKNTIGHIILKGGTSEDIRKEFPDFPINPTKEYFCTQGYKESTAKNYLWKLRRNERIVEEQNKERLCQGIIVASEDVNFNNLLIDTCALTRSKTKELIDGAEHVTFINATIEEMDRKKDCKDKLDKSLMKLAKKVKEYVNLILSDSEKYMLSPFLGMHDERYADNILIQYQQILPRQIRPTLLTADKELAIKARMYQVPFILLSTPNSEEEVSNIVNRCEQQLGFGVWKVMLEDGTLYIENRSNFKVTIVDKAKNETICGKKMKAEFGDKVCVYFKSKRKPLEKRIFKI